MRKVLTSKKKKKKKKDTKGVGWGFTIYSALVWIMISNLAIETAFSDNIWPTWCLPNTETHLT